MTNGSIAKKSFLLALNANIINITDMPTCELGKAAVGRSPVACARFTSPVKNPPFPSWAMLISGLILKNISDR